MDGRDRDLLIEVSTNQKNLFQLVKNFMEESNKRICKIEDGQNKDREDIINIKADIITLKDSKNEYNIRLKTLEDERNISTVGLAKGSVPKLIYLGIVAVVITIVLSAISQFVMYQQTFQKLAPQTEEGRNP
jgi:hypothetical protein